MHTTLAAARQLTSQQIKKELARRRLLQEDVAARCGEHQTTVSRTINRSAPVSARRTARVFAALDVLFAKYQPINGMRRKQGNVA